VIEITFYGRKMISSKKYPPAYSFLVAYFVQSYVKQEIAGCSQMVSCEGSEGKKYFLILN
jgi:hypothetical protein